MSKKARYIISLFVILFCISFLIPTFKWYFIYTEKDRKEATYQGEVLKEEINKKVNAAIEKLRNNEKLDTELKLIRKAFNKEMKKLKKINPGLDFVSADNMSFIEMEKKLLEKRKEKYVTPFFRNILENYYQKYYDERRNTKKNIIKLGLDLQGGAYAVITVNFDHPTMKQKYPKGISESDKREMIKQAIYKIENRINKWGVSETSIQEMRGQNKILINLPGVKETQELREIIETVGVLEFKLVSKEGSETLAKIKSEEEAQGRSIFDSEGKVRKDILEKLPPDTEPLFVSDKDKWGNEKERRRMLVVEKESLLGQNVKIQSASVQQGNLGQYVVNFVLEGEDAKKWAKVTGDNIGREIAIILDNVILQHPVVQEKIPNGRSQITLGNSPIETLQNLALILRSGSLEVPLEISEENTVGASLGQDTIEKGLLACLIGSILVLLFMFIYYNVGGIIADLAVSLNILLLLGGLAMFHGALTLPGLAGIVLTVGMAVDANVIIYERIKEEFRSGKSFKTAVSLGFDRAFWTIFDSNITTFLPGIGIALFGTGAIKGFAVTLCLGIVCSMFTALFVSRLLFDTLLSIKEFKTLRLLSFKGK